MKKIIFVFIFLFIISINVYAKIKKLNEHYYNFARSIRVFCIYNYKFVIVEVDDDSVSVLQMRDKNGNFIKCTDK
jgi:hypothetical protein